MRVFCNCKVTSQTIRPYSLTRMAITQHYYYNNYGSYQINYILSSHMFRLKTAHLPDPPVSGLLSQLITINPGSEETSLIAVVGLAGEFYLSKFKCNKSCSRCQVEKEQLRHKNVSIPARLGLTVRPQSRCELTVLCSAAARCRNEVSPWEVLIEVDGRIKISRIHHHHHHRSYCQTPPLQHMFSLILSSTSSTVFS